MKKRNSMMLVLTIVFLLSIASMIFFNFKISEVIGANKELSSLYFYVAGLMVTVIILFAINLFVQNKERKDTEAEWERLEIAKKNSEAQKELLEKDKENIEAEKERLELLTSSVFDGMCISKVADEMTFISINKEFSNIFGYSQEEFKNTFGDKFGNQIYDIDRAKVLKSVYEQIRKSGYYECEYRAFNSERKIIWISEKGRVVGKTDGQKICYSVMMDITSLKQAEKEQYITEERYRILIEQSTDIIFEYNFLTDKILYLSNYAEKFGYEPITDDFLQNSLEYDDVFEEDKNNFLRLFNRLIAGTSYAYTEYRIKNFMGVYIWCAVRANTIFDESGVPIKAMGKITDIDEQKKETQFLMERSQRDGLTRLYNKEATNTLINEYLKEHQGNGRHVCMFIDIDDFKGVNDTLGHMEGDNVLKNVAIKLQALVRETDVVGRFGGDEFLIFLKDVQSDHIAVQKADEVCQAFRSMRAGGNEDYKISGSVGVSFYPDNGTSLEELKRKADIALYCAKEKGKDCFEVYHDGMKENDEVRDI